MPDFESIPFDGADFNPEDETVNRPAEGARKMTSSDMGEDDWSGGDEGGDFLGLEADLVSGTPPNPAPAAPANYGMPQEPQPLGLADEAAHLDVGAPEPQPITASYASETEFSDESFAEGGYEQDPNGFAPKEYSEEYGDDGYGDDDLGGADLTDDLRPTRSARSGILISVGLALGMGAVAVVAMDYFGLTDEGVPTEVASTAGPAPTARETRPEAPAQPTVVKNDSSSLAEVTPAAPTWSAEATETPAFEEGPDPLIGKLMQEGTETNPATTPEGPVAVETPSVEVPSSETTTAFAGETDWENVEGTSSPVGTIAGWFAEDGAQPMREQVASAAGTTGSEVDGSGSLQTSPTPAPTVRFTDEPAGPVAPENTGMAASMIDGGDAPANVEREGTAAFAGLAVTPVLPATRAADDLAMMDVVWRGEEVPFDMIASAARIWTPQVGPVRVTTKRGEVFEGRLTAVGKRRVWLGAENGEMALDGDTVALIEHMSHTPDPDTDAEVAAAAGKRVKVTAPGGTFEGTVLSVSGSMVTVVTDAGGRITLEDPAIEPVREGIKVKVKL